MSLNANALPQMIDESSSASSSSASPPPSAFRDELSLALDAAAAAAELIASRAGAAEVREKGRADLVTAVDEAAERVVAARVRERFPGDVVVGEELSSGTRARTGRRWIVDPIDGTTNFVHGHPFVCVSIAFADDEGWRWGC